MPQVSYKPGDLVYIKPYTLYHYAIPKPNGNFFSETGNKREIGLLVEHIDTPRFGDMYEDAWMLLKNDDLIITGAFCLEKIEK